eukprot:gene10798-biopygen13251
MRPSPSGIRKLAGKSEAHVSPIITRSLTKKAETERKQAKDIYGHDKISQRPRYKVKTPKVAYSQVSKDVAKSASRNPLAWQNRFALLSSDDESSDLETSKNHTQTRSTEASEVQTAKERRTTKKIQRRAENKRNKKNILIIGDSILKHLDGRKLKGSLRNGQNVYVKSFSGANVEDMADYSKPPMKKNPDIVVLHVGTNSLGTNKPADEIASEICDLAADLRNGANEVVVSAIISRDPVTLDMGMYLYEFHVLLYPDLSKWQVNFTRWSGSLVIVPEIALGLKMTSFSYTMYLDVSLLVDPHAPGTLPSMML